jgi:hypothetical protein
MDILPVCQFPAGVCAYRPLSLRQLPENDQSGSSITVPWFHHQVHLPQWGFATYRVRVNANERAEVAASVAAHSELGSHYDSAVAEGLIERIGEEIDRRVDARLRGGQQAAPAPAPPMFPVGPRSHGAVAPQPQSASTAAERRSNGVTGMILGLGSLGLGVGATAVVVNGHVSSAAAVIMVLLIWVAIAIVNAAHSQRR